MEITQNQLIASILILLLIWVCFTWDTSIEKFTENVKWDKYYYYNSLDKYPMVSPSITLYDDSNYKFSEKALKILKENEKKKKRRSRVKRQSKKVEIPVPRNVHSGQTIQVGGPENVMQPGACLQEVIEQEKNIMHPEMIRDDESILHELPKHNVHEFDTINEEIVSDELMPETQQKSQKMDKIMEMPKVNISQTDSESNDQFNLALATLIAVLTVGFAYFSL